MTPLLCCLTQKYLKMDAVRVLRMLIDAGADTTTIFIDRDTNESAGYTALEIVNNRISNHFLKFGLGDDSNTVRAMQGVRRLLMREEAVHARSWGWSADTNAQSAATLLPLSPMRRERRATKSRVVLCALRR